MNINQDNTKSSQERLLLPEPDPANITVLTPNLPNTPILPWNRFKSPQLNDEALRTKSSVTSKINKFTITTIIFVMAVLLKNPKFWELVLSLQLRKNSKIKEGLIKQVE